MIWYLFMITKFIWSCEAIFYTAYFIRQWLYNTAAAPVVESWPVYFFIGSRTTKQSLDNHVNDMDMFFSRSNDVDQLDANIFTES